VCNKSSGLGPANYRAESFLQDVYHEQRIIKDKVVPREIVESAVHFRPEFMGVNVPKGIYMHICGTDLIRDSDGNIPRSGRQRKMPFGSFLPLENRQAMKRVFPNLFSRHAVQTGRQLLPGAAKRLRYIAPDIIRAGGRAATPGIYNSALFRALVSARTMGIEIVVGADLGDPKWLPDDEDYQRLTPSRRSLSRIDDDFLDPAVFRKILCWVFPASWMSIEKKCKPGQLDRDRSGGRQGDLLLRPQMIKYYLDQDPILPNVPTYLSHFDSDRAYILEHLP